MALLAQVGNRKTNVNYYNHGDITKGEHVPTSGRWIKKREHHVHVFDTATINITTTHVHDCPSSSCVLHANIDDAMIAGGTTQVVR